MENWFPYWFQHWTAPFSFNATDPVFLLLFFPVFLLGFKPCLNEMWCLLAGVHKQGVTADFSLKYR